MENFDVSITRGNIININADVIVNSANNSLERGVGSNNAIFAAAGEELVAACKDTEFCATGKAIYTNGFKTSAKYIIHAVAPFWHGGYDNEAIKLISCYIEIMKLVQKLGVNSVAIPAIATGDGKYPVSEAADIAIATIKSYIAHNDFRAKITFMCTDPDTQNKFREANAKPFIDITPYLKREDIKVTAKLRIEEQSLLKPGAFKKDVPQKNINNVVMMVLKRKLKEINPYAILLTKTLSNEIDEAVIERHDGKTGPYVTMDSISDIQYTDDSISFVIKPICIKTEKETREQLRLMRREADLKAAQVDKDPANPYETFDIEGILSFFKPADNADEDVKEEEKKEEIPEVEEKFEDKLEVDVRCKTYTGKKIEPKVTSSKLTPEDYTVEYKDNLNVGMASIVITGRGNYTGTVVKKFKIKKKILKKTDFKIEVHDKIYSGLPHSPVVAPIGIQHSDFEVAYMNNKNVGTAIVKITGKNNCEGEINFQFKILPKPIREDDFVVNYAD